MGCTWEHRILQQLNLFAKEESVAGIFIAHAARKSVSACAWARINLKLIFAIPAGLRGGALP
jgi:hypothetical protein